MAMMPAVTERIVKSAVVRIEKPEIVPQMVQRNAHLPQRPPKVDDRGPIELASLAHNEGESIDVMVESTELLNIMAEMMNAAVNACHRVKMLSVLLHLAEVLVEINVLRRKAKVEVSLAMEIRDLPLQL